MKLRRIMAATTASALAVGGLMLGGSAAVAAPPTAYLPLAGIAVPTDSTAEAAVYNTWHLDPDHQAGVSQQPNGLLVSSSGGDALVMLGNGNDIVKTDPLAAAQGPDVENLSSLLSVLSSDNSKVAFQIPVFYAYNTTSANAWKYTTLYKNAADTSDNWISTADIVDPANPATIVVPKNMATDIAAIADALDASNSDSRPIGAGFIVKNSAVDVLVSSFTINGATTKFYESAASPVNTTALGEFVDTNGIRPNEDTYPGWHQGVSGADRGTFASVVNGQAIDGLLVTGQSQILNGFAPENFLNNNLPALLNAGVSVHGVPAGDAAGYTLQVPLFFYTEGEIGQQFTTLRIEIPADGVIPADLSIPWTTSRAIPGAGVGAHEAGALGDLLGAMSSYQVIGYGAYIEAGQVTLHSITFNGLTTSFVKAAPVPAPKPAGPQAIANTGAGDITPMIGMAALALLALGGVTLAARRVRQG